MSNTTEETLSSMLANHYELGEIISCYPAAFGATNEVYFVATEQGHWVLIIYADTGAIGELIDIQNKLIGIGIPTARAIVNIKGQFVSNHDGKQFVLYERIRGQMPEQTGQQMEVAGNQLAKLHLADCDIKRQLPIYINELSHWLAASASQTVQEAKRAQEAAVVIEQFQQLDLPSGFIHGDWFMDNAICLENRVAMIDWELSGQGPFIYDIAIALNDWAVRHNQPDDLLVEAFLRGYQLQMPLSLKELEALPLARRLAAIRFWLSRIHQTNHEAQLQKDPEGMWQLYESLSEYGKDYVG